MLCSSWPSQRARSERIHQARKKQRRHESSFCGTVKRPVGRISNNAVIAKTRVLKRISKNDTALHKHMKWLKNLQEDLRKANESKRHDEQQRMKRRSDFMERESKKRLIKRAAKEEALREAEFDGENAPPTHPSATNSSSLAADESSSMKPAWCQSKEAADTAQEMAEINEEADLLDFVHDLDFDQYNQDLELQVLLGQVKDRIKKLQREKKKDETTLQTCVDVSNCLSDSTVFFTCFFFPMSYTYSWPDIYRVKMLRLALNSWITSKLLLILYPQTLRQMRKFMTMM